MKILKAKRALNDCERWNRTILDHIPIAFVAVDKKGIIAEWSNYAETISGWSRQEAMGREFSEIVLFKNVEKGHLQLLEDCILQTPLSKSMEITAIDRNGKEFTAEFIVTSCISAGTEYFMVFIQDVSLQKALLLEQKKLAEIQSSKMQLEQVAYHFSEELKEPIRTISLLAQVICNKMKDAIAEQEKGMLDEVVSATKKLRDLIERFRLQL